MLIPPPRVIAAAALVEMTKPGSTGSPASDAFVRAAALAPATAGSEVE